MLVCQIASYRYCQRHFGRDDFSYGQFGENLTVDGMPDTQVCIGDRYLIGEAEFEVTQPRVTCYRVGLRLGEPELPALLVSGQASACASYGRDASRPVTRSPLLTGDVTYSPDPLEAPPAGQVLRCCSQPGTDVVLDT